MAAFDPKRFIAQATAEAKENLSGKRVVGLVSGGVDSAVAAVITSYAVGDAFLGIQVDNGLMRYVGNDRKPESPYVTGVLKNAGVNMRLANAQDEFYSALKGLVEPEKKRKAIGKTFIDVAEREASTWNADYLMQGTIAPDKIESGGGMRDTIKSHHNVGGLPEKMKLKLYEPLRDLYKDEVRKVARELHLPAEICNRQPFPGPGLAIRVLGVPLTKENVEVERVADWIWCNEVEKAIKAGEIQITEGHEPQYFTGYAPEWRTVGVHGDVRAYGGTILACFITTIDHMSSAFGKLPGDLLETAASKITNELAEHVTRVFYDINHKPPATTEFE